jgi:hypothetical protein
VIDRELLAGKSMRDLSQRFRLSHSAIFRHKQGHLSLTLAKATALKQTAMADSMLARVRELSRETRGILKESREPGDRYDGHLAIKAIARLERQLELETLALQYDTRVVVADFARFWADLLRWLPGISPEASEVVLLCGDDILRRMEKEYGGGDPGDVADIVGADIRD